MRCRDVEALCTKYIDGELDERRASAMRGHLRTCPRCLARVDDEAAMCAAAAGLEPLDPPASLWTEIEVRLGEEEIADANRSRLWFWWQGLRQYALPAAVIVAAVVALFLWSRGRSPAPFEEANEVAARTGGESAAELVEPLTVDPAAETTTADDGCGGATGEEATFLEQRRTEVICADHRYAAVIDELRTMIEDERLHWSVEMGAVFDAENTEIETAVRHHRQKLAVNQSHDPTTRDALYAVYQTQISFLQRAALGDLPR